MKKKIFWVRNGNKNDREIIESHTVWCPRINQPSRPQTIPAEQRRHCSGIILKYLVITQTNYWKETFWIRSSELFCYFQISLSATPLIPVKATSQLPLWKLFFFCSYTNHHHWFWKLSLNFETAYIR